MRADERSPVVMRNLLMERIRQICLGKVDGNTESLYHLAGAINKSIEMECRLIEAKNNAKAQRRDAAQPPREEK